MKKLFIVIAMLMLSVTSNSAVIQEFTATTLNGTTMGSNFGTVTTGINDGAYYWTNDFPALLYIYINIPTADYALVKSVSFRYKFNAGSGTQDTVDEQVSFLSGLTGTGRNVRLINTWYTTTLNIVASSQTSTTSSRILVALGFNTSGLSLWVDDIKLHTNLTSGNIVYARELNAKYDYMKIKLVSENVDLNVRSIQLARPVSVDSNANNVTENIDLPMCSWIVNSANYTWRNYAGPITGVYRSTANMQLFLSDCTLNSAIIYGSASTVTINLYQLTEAGVVTSLAATNTIGVTWTLNQPIVSTNIYYFSTTSSGNLYLYDTYLTTTRKQPLKSRWQ